jgi:hypothetical protein
LECIFPLRKSEIHKNGVWNKGYLVPWHKRHFSAMAQNFFFFKMYFYQNKHAKNIKIPKMIENKRMRLFTDQNILI